MIILTVPIFVPVIIQLGFDPIWFGIVIVMVTELAQITPPVGVNVFIIQSVIREVPMATIFRGAFPFMVANLVGIIIITMVPAIALLLPNAMH
jgi:TRAP-type C4-dicarboxylate transport system permease large subunit